MIDSDFNLVTPFGRFKKASMSKTIPLMYDAWFNMDWAPIIPLGFSVLVTTWFEETFAGSGVLSRLLVVYDHNTDTTIVRVPLYDLIPLTFPEKPSLYSGIDVTDTVVLPCPRGRFCAFNATTMRTVIFDLTKLPLQTSSTITTVAALPAGFLESEVDNTPTGLPVNYHQGNPYFMPLGGYKGLFGTYNYWGTMPFFVEENGDNKVYGSGADLILLDNAGDVVSTLGTGYPNAYGRQNRRVTLTIVEGVTDITIGPLEGPTDYLIKLENFGFQPQPDGTMLAYTYWYSIQGTDPLPPTPVFPQKAGTYTPPTYPAGLVGPSLLPAADINSLSFSDANNQPDNTAPPGERTVTTKVAALSTDDSHGRRGVDRLIFYPTSLGKLRGLVDVINGDVTAYTAAYISAVANTTQPNAVVADALVTGWVSYITDTLHPAMMAASFSEATLTTLRDNTKAQSDTLAGALSLGVPSDVALPLSGLIADARKKVSLLSEGVYAYRYSRVPMTSYPLVLNTPGVPTGSNEQVDVPDVAYAQPSLSGNFPDHPHYSALAGKVYNGYDEFKIIAGIIEGSSKNPAHPEFLV